MNILHKNVKVFLKKMLTPDLVVDSLTSLPVKVLKDKGIEYVLLDMDNTFLAPDKSEVSPKFKQWIQDAKNQYMQVYIVTNNSNKAKVEKIAKVLEIGALYRAIKPFAFALEEFAYQYDIRFEKSALIGNQLLTDVLSANWTGCYSVLTEPVDKQLSFVKTLQQDIEDFIRKNWLNTKVS